MIPKVNATAEIETAFNMGKFLWPLSAWEKAERSARTMAEKENKHMNADDGTDITESLSRLMTFKSIAGLVARTPSPFPEKSSFTPGHTQIAVPLFPIVQLLWQFLPYFL